MLTRRLAACDGGAASIELVLALPTILVVLLVIIHVFQFQRVSHEMIAATRTAAWNSARNDVCLAMPARQGEVFRAYMVPLPPFCAERGFRGENTTDAFWKDAEGAAAWRRGDLTADVRRSEELDFVVARSIGRYEVANLGAGFGTWLGPEHAVPEATFWLGDDPALKTGFDRVLENALGRSNELFPGLFPNVR